MKFLVFFTLCLTIPILVYGHGGGLNSAGCHNDNINGGYHCHDGSSDGFNWAGKEVITHNDPYKEDEDLDETDDGTIKDLETLKGAFPRNLASNIKLKQVVDGDTIIVTKNGQDYKIRLYGIDSPETYQKGGEDSNISLFFMLEGKQLTLETKDYDQYGRVVGIVYANGLNANEEMIRQGEAWQYKKYCKEEFCNEWSELEEEAKSSEKGLWQDEAPEAPWSWRQKEKAKKLENQHN